MCSASRSGSSCAEKTRQMYMSASGTAFTFRPPCLPKRPITMSTGELVVPGAGPASGRRMMLVKGSSAPCVSIARSDSARSGNMIATRLPSVAKLLAKSIASRTLAELTSYAEHSGDSMKSVGSGGNSISISLYPSSMAAPVDFCAAAMHCGNVDGTGSRASSETGAAAGADEDRAARRDELAIAGDRAARRRAGLRALGRMNAMAVPQNWRRIADRMVVGLAEVVVLTGYRLSWPENGGALKTAIGLARCCEVELCWCSAFGVPQ
mmetsp:Transcript_73477/g.209060  ORF Transcript_73477/g.209060 Transcript_73477/m.209060 type:complete len:266 (-) Transcript_73477:38-835(-)